MQITKKELGKNQLELTIEISPEEIAPHLEKAANKLSQKHKVPGFRPGKAPLEMIKNKFGEATLLQEALDFIISDSFFKAVTREKIETVGQPQINVEKLAPGNPLIYKAVVFLLPKVTLGEWQKQTVSQKEAKATAEDIEKTIEQLREMNVQESIVDRPAKKDDKVEVDFEVLINKAVIEGGKSSKYPVIIGQGRMIPGFEDKLIGAKAGEEKEFELKFPEKYFQKNLAGKLATFKVKILNVYERKLPNVDDQLAKNLGFESLDKLKAQLEQNITQDKKIKEKQRVEGEAIAALVKSSQIDEIPENLIANETQKMAMELEHSIRSQGMDMAGYLKSINKTREDLSKDFRPQAQERIKAALALRQLALEEKIAVTEAELDEEIKKQETAYEGNPQALQNIHHPQYRGQLKNILTNQKVIKLITDQIVK